MRSERVADQHSEYISERESMNNSQKVLLSEIKEPLFFLLSLASKINHILMDYQETNNESKTEIPCIGVD